MSGDLIFLGNSTPEQDRRLLAELERAHAVLEASKRRDGVDDVAGREDPITGVPQELRGQVARLSASGPCSVFAG